MLPQTDLKPYPRPDITEADMQTARDYAVKAMSGRNHQQRVAFVALVLAENARLLAEVQAHRATLGYEPLPVWSAK